MKTWMPSSLLFITLCSSCVAKSLGQAPADKKEAAGKPLLRGRLHQTMESGNRVFPLPTRTADGYRTTGQQVARTIVLAYFPQLDSGTMSTAQVTGGPGWLMDQYDIQARVSESDLAEWQKQGFQPENEPLLSEMLRTMLVERFKLRAHLVQTETDGFKLNVAKIGPKLARGIPFDPTTVKGRLNRTFEDGGKLVMVPEDHAGSDGLTALHPTFYNASMADFARWLSSNLGTIVQDNTGLTGRYNFVFSWPSRDSLENDGGPQRFIYYEGLAKLGLKVDSTKVPMKELVIDHIEKPTPN